MRCRERLGGLLKYYERAQARGLHQAKLAQEDKHYEQALKYIETAIAMQPDNLPLYNVRKEIELASGAPAEQVNGDLLAGYFQASFVLKRRGNPDDERLLEDIRIKIHTELAQNRPKP